MGDVESIYRDAFRFDIAKAFRTGVLTEAYNIMEHGRWKMPNITLQPRQQEFIDCDADEVLFGGAAGGGKSVALLYYSIKRRWLYPGSNGLIVRRSYAELSKEGCLIPMSHDWLRGIATWNGSDKKWTFPDGGTITFGYCANDADKYKYQGTEWDDICYDESTLIPESPIKYINGRARTPRKDLKVQKRYATNPVGVSMLYFKDKFVDASPPGTKFTATEKLLGKPIYLTRCFIPAKIKDNDYIDEDEYAKTLVGLDEEEAQALVEGRWDVMAGRYYKQFILSRHVCTPFQIPEHWNVYVGIDYGYNNPTGILWGAMSNDGVMYIFKEERFRQKEVDEVCQILKTSESDWMNLDKAKIVKYCAGPDLFSFSARERGGPNDAEVFKRNGIPILNVCPGAIGKRDRYTNARRYIRWKDINNEEIDGRPLVKIFDRCAPYLVRQLQEAMIDPDDRECVSDNPADDQGNGGDDVHDSFTHLLMGRPIKSQEPKTLPKYGTNKWFDINQNKRRKGKIPEGVTLGSQ